MDIIEKYEKILGLKYDVLIKIGDKYDSYKARAKSKNIKFDLPFRVFDMLIKMPCQYCGLKKDMDVVGIDRFDNEDGYVNGNCVPCCWDCNRSKSNMKALDYIAYIKRFNPNLDEQKITLTLHWKGTP